MWIRTKEGWKQLSPRIFQPAVAVMRPYSVEEAQREMAKRVSGYERNVQKALKGELALEQLHTCWSAEITGPFGEPIR